MTTTTETTTTTAAAPPRAGIAITGLAKTFRGPSGPVRAVRGVDLRIAPGETVALFEAGPDGVRNPETD